MPPELRESFTALEVLEFNFEHGNWKEAESAMSRLETLFNKVVENPSSGVSSQLLYDFGYSFGKLRVSLADRNEKNTQTYFIDVHDLFLRLSANFAYTVPPALAAIEDCVGEARIWLSKGDYGQDIYEMREVGRYFRNLYSLLEEQDVDSSKVWTYHRQINQVMAAAESGDYNSTAAALQDLEEQTAALLAVFLDANSRRNVNAETK